MMKRIALLSAFLVSLCLYAPAQSAFYTPLTIQNIEIFFPMQNWDYVLDTTKLGTEGYTVADSVRINGTVFSGAGVKYKGSSSYDSARAKNPLHIKLNETLSGANYLGVQDVKLSNCYSDPSMIREVMGYEILRNYLNVPYCNFARVYINGVYYGVYSNSEDLDDPFFHRNYFSTNRSQVKANPVNVISGQLPNLAYLGTDSTLYFNRYELKSDYGWSDLIHMCDTLNNATQYIDRVLDVDRALWMLAFNNVAVNLDSYTGAFAQNYYLYKDFANRMCAITWDLNMCFGAFTNTGSANLNLSSMQQMSPVLQSSNPARPLISKLLADARYRKMYIAHMRTINEENFLSGNYLTRANQYITLIDSSVAAETMGFYSHAQFQQGMNTTVGGVVGLDQLMSTRANWLDTTAEFQAVPPVISNVATSTATPAFASSFQITASVTNASAVFLGYRLHKTDAFVRIAMLDDGLHGDGAAGDNVYGADVQANSLEIQYYVYADNANAGIFSPERAEHDFYIVQPSISPALQLNVVINEFSANNVNGILNEDGKARDWIEIYNTTSSPLGLGSLYLSDNISNPFKWHFPNDAFILPNDHLLVWADDNNAEWLDIHTNFNLNNSGDSLILMGNNVIFDSISFPAPGSDTIYARCPDGSGAFQLSVVSTPRNPNVCSMVGSESEMQSGSTLLLYPNPGHEALHIRLQGEDRIVSIRMFDATGKEVHASAPGSNEWEIATAQLCSGIYILRMETVQGHRFSERWIRQ